MTAAQAVPSGRQSRFDTSADAGADIAERGAATHDGLTHSESKHEYHRT